MGLAFQKVNADTAGADDMPQQYPALPRGLLKTIYEGREISVHKRASTYVVILSGSAIHADDVSIMNWLRHYWGDKLDSTQFHLALQLLCKRVKMEVSEDQRLMRIKQREDERAERMTWSPYGADLKGFFGR